MNQSTKEIEIKKVFNKLIENKIEYIVLRGFLDIPHHVSINNDIDLICSLKEKKQINKLFSDLDYKYHEDSREVNTYLYHAQPHEHFYCKRRDLHFDIVYSLSYRSPNMGEWVSVHEEIQSSIWKNKITNNKFWLYQPSNTDLVVHLICHSIFDKKEFKNKHIKQIEEALSNIDDQRYYYLLELVFFKFTPYLIEYIKGKDYKEIIKNYLQFKEY